MRGTKKSALESKLWMKTAPLAFLMMKSKRKSRAAFARDDCRVPNDYCLSGVTINPMDPEIDYTQRSELELVEIFGRLDPRYAPAECARLGKYLSELGYIVADGETGPGSVTPSPEIIEKLIGTTTPFQCAVEFEPNNAFFRFVGLTKNLIGFTGSGTLVTDGLYVWISGPVASGSDSLLPQNIQLSCLQIANVESADHVVRFEYNVIDVCGDAMSLSLADATTAAQLVRILPKRRTKDFRPRLNQ
jgi:hypothetical protein